MHPVASDHLKLVGIPGRLRFSVLRSLTGVIQPTHNIDIAFLVCVGFFAMSFRFSACRQVDFSLEQTWAHPSDRAGPPRKLTRASALWTCADCYLAPRRRSRSAASTAPSSR